jgi:hypothetical protein
VGRLMSHPKTVTEEELATMKDKQAIAAGTAMV